MRSRLLAAALICAPLFLAVPSGTAADAPEGIPGIGPVGKIVKLHTGFDFTEGPAADGAGNVYFSDIPKQKIYKVDLAGKLSAFLEKTNHTNGLMVNGKGEIVACEMDGAVVAFSPDGKERRVLAGKYKGKRFNAPNDLVLDKVGGVYFTDPAFRAPTPLPPKGRDALASGVELPEPPEEPA